MTSNQSAVQVAWRCLAIGLLYMVAGVVTEMVAQTQIGSPYLWWMPLAGHQPDGLAEVAWLLAAGCILGLALRALAERLTVPFASRAGAIFFVMFIFVLGLPSIELIFAHHIALDRGLLILLLGLPACAAQATAAAWLFPPAGEDVHLAEALTGAWRGLPWWSWASRIGLVALLWVPTYLVIGAVFVADGLLLNHLKVGIVALLAVQVAHALLVAAAAFPILVLLRGPRWKTAFQLGLVLAVVGGWVPLLGSGPWRADLLITWGLHITCESVAQCLAIYLLMWLPRDEYRTRPIPKANPEG